MVSGRRNTDGGFSCSNCIARHESWPTLLLLAKAGSFISVSCLFVCLRFLDRLLVCLFTRVGFNLSARLLARSCFIRCILSACGTISETLFWRLFWRPKQLSVLRRVFDKYNPLRLASCSGPHTHISVGRRCSRTVVEYVCQKYGDTW